MNVVFVASIWTKAKWTVEWSIALPRAAALILLARGVHPKVVSDMLGHATIALTLDTYSHVIPSLQQEAANVVAAAVLDPAVTAPQPGPEGQVKVITSGS